MTTPDPVPPAAPRLQVVRGEPDDVELAALVAGLVAAAGPAAGAHAGDHGDAPRSAWTDRSRGLRAGAAPAAGPDAWRWSLRG